jgi:hypothetical protein
MTGGGGGGGGGFGATMLASMTGRGFSGCGCVRGACSAAAIITASIASPAINAIVKDL